MNKDTVRDALGNQVNLKAVTAALGVREEKLVDRETDAKIRADELAQKAADRLETARRWNREQGLRETEAKQRTQIFNQQRDEHNKKLAADTLTKELTNKFLKIQIDNPELDKASAATDSLRAQLVNQGVDVEVINKSFTQAGSIYSSGSAGTNFKNTLAATTEGFTASKQTLDREYEDIKRRFNKDNNSDPTMVAALQVPDPLDGDMSDKLVDRYVDPEDKTSSDTVQATLQLRGIHDALQTELGDGIKVTGAVIEDLIKQSGHEGRAFWSETATWTENPKIIKNLAARVRSAAEWLPGGSKHNMQQMLDDAKAQADRQLLDAEVQERSVLALESRKALTESFSGVAYTEHKGTTHTIEGKPYTAHAHAYEGASKLLKKANDDLGIQHDSFGRPVLGTDGKPIPFVSEKDRQAAALRAKLADDAAVEARMAKQPFPGYSSFIQRAAGLPAE